MRITMTKAQALAKQAEQIEWYASRWGDDVRTVVANATNADALDDDVDYDVVTINRHIPRGGAIEALMGRAQHFHD